MEVEFALEVGGGAGRLTARLGGYAPSMKRLASSTAAPAVSP
jgi:hypothetical protein